MAISPSKGFSRWSGMALATMPVHRPPATRPTTMQIGMANNGTGFSNGQGGIHTAMRPATRPSRPPRSVPISQPSRKSVRSTMEASGRSPISTPGFARKWIRLALTRARSKSFIIACALSVSGSMK